MNLVLLFSALFVASCSSIQRMATRSTTPLFQESGKKITREFNWEFFRNATPANLKFMEMIYLSDTKNHDQLGVLVKGFAGYAYAVAETLNYGDELSGREESKWKKEAISHYTRALDYGLLYLKEKDISHGDLLSLQENELSLKLDKELSTEDLTPTLYFAQAWGSLINLQKDNVALISQVPKVKILFDWICKKDPKIDHGFCDIFYAQYEASRPRISGGDPKKAEELYLAAMKKYPKHLLIHVGYLQYVVLPAMDLEKYDKEAIFLKSEFEKFRNLNRDTLENKSEYEEAGDLNLFNAIAEKRFEMMEKNKKKIF